MSNLDGLSFYANHPLEDFIMYNLQSFLSYGWLEIGAYHNIPTGYVNYLGADYSRLAPVSATGITPYTQWRGSKHDWVYESALSDIVLTYSNGNQPNVPSGIVVDGTFYPTGTAVRGTGYVIDFTHGGVTFDYPMPSSSIIQVPHALRHVQVYQQSSDLFSSLNYDWFKGYNPSGTRTTELEKYLPAIFVGLRGWRTLSGRELGSRDKWALAEIDFEVITTTKWDNKRIVDTLYMLETKTVELFNVNTAPKPLNVSGFISVDAQSYPAMVSGYYLSEGRFREDARIMKLYNPDWPFHRTKVTIGFEFSASPD